MIDDYMPLRMIVNWPNHQFPLPEGDTSLLDYVGVGRSRKQFLDSHDQTGIDVHILKEVSIGLAGFEGWEVVFGGKDGITTFTADLIFADEFQVLLKKIDVTLRLPSRWFRKMHLEDGQFVEARNADGERSPYEIKLASIDVSLSLDEDLEMQLAIMVDDAGLDLDPVMIAGSGVVLSMNNIHFNLNGSGERPEHAPEAWRGIYIEQADIYLPELMDGYVSAQGMGIGTGGFYGVIEGIWSLQFNREEETFQGDLAGQLMGMKGGISSIALEFVQSVPVQGEIEGKLMLPFFEEPVDIRVVLGAEGQFGAGLTNTDAYGLYILRREGVLEAAIESLSFTRKDRIWTASIVGEIRPLAGDVDWPSFKVEDLTIDSQGRVSTDGGWVDVPEKVGFNFYGFEADINKVGFGMEEDEQGREWKWIGLSGGISLVEGLQAGGSVEGLKIKWCRDEQGLQTDIELKGIGVHFEIPEVIEFDGYVSFIRNGQSGFQGDLSLSLPAVGVTFDASIVIGKNHEQPSYSFYYVFINADLPAGIPLGTSGVALYGMAGFFASNMEPDKDAEDHWYEDWYKKSPKGITSVKKWTDQRDAMAFGAGVSLGTVTDNGYMVSANTLLAIVLPGPILIIEGKANFLQSRADMDTEGKFSTLAVLDNRAGELLMNISASYKFDGQGRVLDIYAGAEAFFDYNRSDHWYFHLGRREPSDQRIQAQIMQLYGAQAYFMLEPGSLTFGYWQGFDGSWKFGPVGVAAAAWAEANIKATVGPQQFWGRADLHGSLDVEVFRFNFGFYLDAGFEVNTPTPYSLLAHLAFGVSLPWPFPDFDIEIDLKWTKDQQLPTPLPLKEVSIAHELIQQNMLLKRGEQLLPVYDSDGDGFVNLSSPVHTLPEKNDLPVVPLDAKLVLTFNKPVWDEAKVAYNRMPVEPAWQEVTFYAENEDDNRNDAFRFELTKIRLERKSATGWPQNNQDPTHSHSVYGVWLPVEDEQGKPRQTKLQLWTKNPFTYTRYASRDAADSFVEHNLHYPCVPSYKVKLTCDTFDHLQYVMHEQKWQFESVIAEVYGLHGEMTYMDGQFVIGNVQQIPLDLRSLFRLPVDSVSVDFDFILTQSHATISIYDDSEQLMKEQSFQFNLDNVEQSFSFSWSHQNTETARYIVMTLTPVQYSKKPDLKERHKKGHRHPIDFQCQPVQLCFTPFVEWEKEQTHIAYQEQQQELYDSVAGEEHLLLPYSQYRLCIETVLRKKEGDSESEQRYLEYAYFQTEGPPGFIDLPGNVIPAPSANETSEESIEQGHPLQTLHPYVKKTIPENGQRTFYHAYDIQVAFAQAYVQMMYRLGQHGLALRLFDQNLEPVTDVNGRKMNDAYIWRKQIEFGQNQSQQSGMSYDEMLRLQKCIDVGESSGQPQRDILFSSVLNRFLKPGEKTIAQLQEIPLFDSFEKFDDEQWTIVKTNETEGTTTDNQAEASWVVKQMQVDKSIHYLTLMNQVPSYCLFHHLQLTDMRLTCQFSAHGDGAIGVVFAYQDRDHYYKFVLDQQTRVRRLIRIEGGTSALLYENWFRYESEVTYTLTVEVTDGHMSVFFDGKWLFELHNLTIPPGYAGMYAGSLQEARFFEWMLEDLSVNQQPLYEFEWINSRFANFHHHLHSFNGRCWQAEISDEVHMDGETFEDIWPFHVQRPQHIEIESVQNGETVAAFLFRSPEPVDWRRVHFQVKVSNILIETGNPEKVKLISWEAHTHHELNLLVRQQTRLDNWRIEYATDTELSEWKIYYAFQGLTLLSKTHFSDDDFESSTNRIVKHKYITPQRDYQNVKYTVGFALQGKDTQAGLYFQYIDEDLHYQLLFSNEGGMELIKVKNGKQHILWPEQAYDRDFFKKKKQDVQEVLRKVGYNPSIQSNNAQEPVETYRVTIDVQSVNIKICLNGDEVATVHDPEVIATGGAGLFTNEWSRTHFHLLTVSEKRGDIIPAGQEIRLQETGVINPDFMHPHEMSQKRKFRIIDENGQIVHERTLVSKVNKDKETDEWNDVSSNVIPSSDGASALIIPEKPLSEDKHVQFRFEYAREKEGLPTLYQWGSVEKETVELDFQLSRQEEEE